VWTAIGEAYKNITGANTFTVTTYALCSQ
jgi:hypothetical protein